MKGNENKKLFRDVDLECLEVQHRSVTFFEDAPCYQVDKLVQLYEMRRRMLAEKDGRKKWHLVGEYQAFMDEMKKRKDAPPRIYLWQNGNMPETGKYVENPKFRYNHDPDFKPYMYEFLLPEDIIPKGAVILCAGGDHGDCVIHEAFQSCFDFNRLGYQSFMLLNRTNRMPYTGQECGADVARLIRMIRKNAVRYRIKEDQVAFAGFSNGGLTGEECIRYYSGKQSVTDYFPEYIPDELDDYPGAPDAFLCIYGPRWKGTEIDYTGVAYPPTFFAVGMEDTAMENLHWTYQDLLAHGIRAEVHTFAGVPHGQAGVSILGNREYPNFELWLPLADAFMQRVYQKKWRSV